MLVADPEGKDWVMFFHIFFVPQGITTYFSGNCCLEDAELAQKFLDSKVIDT